MHIQTVKAAYRRYARVYDALFGPVLQPGRKAVVKALGCRPGERVLEVGVGTGLSLPLYPPHTRVTGIDVSTEMLDKARARVENRRLANVEALLEMNAEEMTFPDASFDKVVAMYVVSVVERPARLLEELHRVCRPQGEIFIVNHLFRQPASRRRGKEPGAVLGQARIPSRLRAARPGGWLGAGDGSGAHQPPVESAAPAQRHRASAVCYFVRTAPIR